MTLQQLRVPLDIRPMSRENPHGPEAALPLRRNSVSRSANAKGAKAHELERVHPVPQDDQTLPRRSPALYMAVQSGGRTVVKPPQASHLAGQGYRTGNVRETGAALVCCGRSRSERFRGVQGIHPLEGPPRRPTGRKAGMPQHPGPAAPGVGPHTYMDKSGPQGRRLGPGPGFKALFLRGPSGPPCAIWRTTPRGSR